MPPNFLTLTTRLQVDSAHIPPFLQHRIDIFDRLLADHEQTLSCKLAPRKFEFSTNARQVKPRSEITVTLPNGRTYTGKSWETTPANVALSLSKSLFEQTVIAEVDGELWDLDRPLEQSCSLKLLNFEDPEGKQLECVLSSG